MAYGKIKADALIHDNGGSDVEIQISGIPSATDLAAKAAVASPTFTGTPAAPTAAQGTNTTQLATTEFVNAEIAADLTAAIGNTVQAHDADTAKTDVAQTFTQGQRGGITVMTISSGVTNVDFTSSNNFQLTLSEAVTSITFSNAVAGQSGSIFIVQPSSGGPYAVGGWAAAFKFSGGTAPTITQTASKTDRVDYAIKSSTEIHVVWTGNY